MTTTFVTGPAGTGKTTYALERLREWLTRPIPANNILVLLSQQTQAAPYRALLRDPDLPGAGAVDILTSSSLALRSIDLFWPLVAEPTGFAWPRRRPVFLTIETAQYYLQEVIEPLLTQGYFDPNVVPITIQLPRLMSQILDNLNKAALLGLPHTDVGARLMASLELERNTQVALEHTQACVNAFREFCLAHNLLDFSLRVEVFDRHLWPVDSVRQFLLERYRYLIVENVEEDNPFTHRLLQDWLPHVDEGVVLYDEDAGYRIFLGANARTAHALSERCAETVSFTESHIAPPDMLALGDHMATIISGEPVPDLTQHDPRSVFEFEQTRFYPQLLDSVTARIASLVAGGTAPSDIVVMAPFVSDALRFSFLNRMAAYGIPARSHRPSRPLSEEPAAKAMLTLARVAFPQWGTMPEPYDVTLALHQSIAGLDLIRASLLTQVVYRPYERAQVLTAFEQIAGEMRDRISYQVGSRFDTLRTWLQALREEPTEPPVLDHFFSRLFDEVLSQPAFGFHGNAEAGEHIAQLINSARKFRQRIEQVPLIGSSQSDATLTVSQLNRAYLRTVEAGIMAGQYLPGWNRGDDEAVLITPALTFLISNRPVDYQFWLDAGSNGWWERIAQPLTHPYILAADWEQGKPWTDTEEVAAQQDRLARVVLGLTRRCRKQIFIFNSEIGEQGYEQRGQLLVALQQMLRRLPREST